MAEHQRVVGAAKRIATSGVSRAIALRAPSHMPDFFRHFVEGRVAIDFRGRRFEHHVLVGGIGSDDGVGRHDPDRQAFAAPRVKIARRLQREHGIGGVQRADMLVREAVAGANEDFPQRRIRRWSWSSPVQLRRARLFRACRQRPRGLAHPGAVVMRLAARRAAARRCKGRCRRSPA